MRYLLAVIFAVGFLSRCCVNEASARDTFHFITNRFEIKILEGGVFVVERPVLAMLELSGFSPYDHTSVSSLFFTPAAEEVLGYVGLYKGTFDSSINGMVENNDGILIEKELNPAAVVINAFLRDTDPPIFNSGPFATETNSKLEIMIIRGNEGLTIISTGRGTSLSAIGHWVRVVPEPTSLSCCVVMLLLGARHRTRQQAG